MSYSFPPQVKRLVDQSMASGKYASEDELLQDALESLSAESEELAAIQEALADLDAGDPGVSIAEAFDAIRRRHGEPPGS